MNTKEIKDIITKYFSTRSEIKVGYIFGSRAKGEGNKLSDIDIGILIDEASIQGIYPYGYKAKILTDLSKSLKTNNIDLVILNNAPCLLRHRVVRYGKVVYSCAEQERINFQVRTINEYNDIKRLLIAHH